jgi:peptide/nickel transport system permease protein
MLIYTARRLLQLIPLLWVSSMVIYALLALQPGDPLDELRQSNPNLTSEQLAALAHAYGLDQPIYVRYFRWLTRALQGDLGLSRNYGQPAARWVFQERLPKTLFLSGLALLLALLVAIPVGVISAVRQYSLTDYSITLLSFIGFSTPVFFLGIILLYLFTFLLPETIPHFPRFPSVAAPDILWEDVRTGHRTLLDFLATWAFHLILPVLTLSLIQMAQWARFMRASLLEVMTQDYVRTARAKGLAERWVLYKHALRNSLIPLVTLVGLAIPGVFGGAIITETVFSYPGMGTAILEALTLKDYNVAMAALAFLAILTALSNLVADLAYAVVDPRIRYD